MNAGEKKLYKKKIVGKQTKWNGPPDKHKLIKEGGKHSEWVCCFCQTVSGFCSIREKKGSQHESRGGLSF